ncbi:MAG: response regulator [Clostridiales bacterium]|nr:response regulator [Clostridiales bacterium]
MFEIIINLCDTLLIILKEDKLLKYTGKINFDALDIESQEFKEIVYAVANGYEYLKLVNIKDRESSVIKISPLLDNLIGDSSPENVPVFILENLILPEYKERFSYFINVDRIIDTLNERKKTDTIDIQLLADDGSIIWLRVKVILISSNPEDGMPWSYLATMTDITQEKNDEQKTFEALQVAFDSAQQANSAKSDFLSRMSHDIRTPMNAIIGMTAIAATCLDDKERLSNCLEKINISSKHLMSLINEVLDMSRIESGRMVLSEEKINIHDLVDSLVSIIHPQVENKKQHLEVSVSDITHPYVIGDSLRLQQCFLNFLNNAVKYTPEGGCVTLSVTERPDSSADSSIYEFIIEDNGYGMKPDFLNHIFEPFAREEDSRISKIQGTGLGMPIAYNIVSLMDGSIDVTSIPDKGSKFIVTIRLKVQTGPENQEASSDTQKESETYDFTGKRILIVEDNEINLEIAEELLQMTGATIETAENGKIALDMVRESEAFHYDLIIMDIQMPVMNGYNATMAIRSLDRPDTKSLPIFAMTANAFVEDVDMARNAGMQEHIAKPLNIETLYSAIKKWV